MTAEPAIDLDPALRALADRNRRAILQAIRTEPHQVGAVAAELGLSQQIASHHLGVLRRAGLATSTRDANRRLYAVSTDGLAAVRSYLDDFWSTRPAALKAAVEAHAEAQEAQHGRALAALLLHQYRGAPARRVRLPDHRGGHDLLDGPVRRARSAAGRALRRQHLRPSGPGRVPAHRALLARRRLVGIRGKRRPAAECFTVENGLITDSILIFDRLSFVPPEAS